MSYFCLHLKNIYSKYLGRFKQTSQIFVILLKDKKIKPKSDAQSHLKNHTKKTIMRKQLLSNRILIIIILQIHTVSQLYVA